MSFSAAQLRAAVTTLENAAGGWDDASQGIGEGTDVADSATARITEVWTSNEATEVQRAARTQMTSLISAPDTMDNLRGAFVRLGGTAEDFAEQLQRYEDDADAAREDRDQQRQLLGSGMLEPDHADAVRQRYDDAVSALATADSNAEDVRERWNESCRTFAGEVQDYAHDLVRSAIETGVLDPGDIRTLTTGAGGLTDLLVDLYGDDLADIPLSPEMAEALADEVTENLESMMDSYGVPWDLEFGYENADELAAEYPEFAQAIMLMDVYGDNFDFVRCFLNNVGQEGVEQIFHLIDNFESTREWGSTMDQMEGVDSQGNLDVWLSLLETGSYTVQGRAVLNNFVDGEPDDEFRTRHVTLMLTQPDYHSEVVAGGAEYLLVTSNGYSSGHGLSIPGDLHPEIQLSGQAVAINALSGYPEAATDYLSRGTEHVDAVVNVRIPMGLAADHPLWDDIYDQAGLVILNGLVATTHLDGHSPTQVNRATDNVVAAIGENGLEQHDGLQSAVALAITPHMPRIEDEIQSGGNVHGQSYRDAFGAFATEVARDSPAAGAILVDGALEAFNGELADGVDQFLDPDYRHGGNSDAFGNEMHRYGVLELVAGGIAEGIGDEQERQQAIIAGVQTGTGGVTTVIRGGSWFGGPKGAAAGWVLSELVEWGSGQLTELALDDLPPLDETIRELQQPPGVSLDPDNNGEVPGGTYDSIALYLYENHPELRDPDNPLAIGAGHDNVYDWAMDDEVLDIIRPMAAQVEGAVIDEVLIRIALGD